MRCFIAIEIPDNWRSALTKVCDPTGLTPRGVRWVRPEQYHVTLRFLGEIEDQLVPAISDAVAQSAAQIEPFALRLAGLGAFRSRDVARVVWAGIDDPTHGCQRWIDLAGPALEALGFDADSRPYHPHITLARAKTGRAGHDLNRFVEHAASLPPLSFDASLLTLFESLLGRHGAHYRVLSRVPLTESPEGP